MSFWCIQSYITHQIFFRTWKNSIWRLEMLGFGEKVKEIKSSVCIDFDRLDILNRPWPFIFIGWGGLIPQVIPITYLDLQKTLFDSDSSLDRSDRSVPAGQATVPRPVRPLGQTGQTGWCQFWLSTYAPLFFGKACLPKKHSSEPKLSKGDN